MEERLEMVIRKVIFKKFPSLYEIEVTGQPTIFDNDETSYICKIKSEECLSMDEQMEIDTEAKLIFLMLKGPTNSFRKPSVRCFFDCGKGYEFQSSYGYNH